MADVAELADGRPGSFRLENADSDLAPPAHAIKATRDAVGVDRYNSGLGATTAQPLVMAPTIIRLRTAVRSCGR